jgi:DNA helicase II / ATP-dependent DNA helicase PcrA
LDKDPSDRSFEEKYLKQIITIVQEQLASARLRSKANKASIISAKKELQEDTSHSISNLWSPENFEALVELSQSADQVSLKMLGHEMVVNTMLALEKMMDSPYFARIDFMFEDEDTLEKVYIGRSLLIDDKSHEIYVYDWRSPIASVFYRFGIGKAFYEAPVGKINGEVGLKRQYEIKKGKLEYYFDADIQVVDDFLRKLLSQSASSKMKTIVETIQRDQDVIIRDMETDLMMVQGAAGSGKTSVALHRVAYLMYKGLSEKLSHNDIVVISPNTLFEQYISNVLPDLGENNVDSVVFEEMLRKVLQIEQIQTRNQFLENLLSSNVKKYSGLLKSSMEFKGSSQFVEILKRFLHELPNRWIEFSDVYYDGKHIAARELLKAKILKRNKKSLISLHLEQLENSILELVHEQRIGRLEKLNDLIAKQHEHAFEVEEVARMLSILESTALIKNMRKFTELDHFALYRKLFTNKNDFYRLAKGIELPECIEDIIDLTCENIDNDYLHYDDALALVFLHLKTKGFTDYRGIKQVVIDEAQDYYPIHFEILNSLFSGSRYTILGDVNQTIGKREDLSLYDRISKIFDKDKSTLVTLDKCFRCTSEILAYSTKFLDKSFKLNNFSRKGDTPAVFTAPSRSALDEMIAAEVKTCEAKDYQSIALICKTEQDTISLYGRLKDKIDIQLIRSDAAIDLVGTFVMPLYMSKGLEFDAVLICDVDKAHFNSEDDKNLLYIACTRALHRLNLFYTGEISSLL